jgi:glutathione S-transferase
MIIYGASLSPFVRKALAFANEKGVEFEHQPRMPGADDPEFREASPFGKVPGFRDEDYRLSDSSAIAHYLEAKKPEPALIPNEPQARGRVCWFDEYADTILAPACGAVFFNEVAAKMFGREGDPAATKLALEETIPPALAYLESQLGDGDFLVGDTLTLADLAVVSPTKNLDYGAPDFDWSAYPKVSAHRDRILARDSFAAGLAMDAGFLNQG